MKNRLLFVCLGNICRSPAAEAVFLSQIKTKGVEDLFEVDSAGTGSWHVGNQADSRMIVAAQRRGIEIKSIARQIKISDLTKFNLILTMDRSNFEDVISLSEKDNNINHIAEIKPILAYSKNINLLDVPDPYYGGEKGFDDVLDILDDAISCLLAELI